MPKVVRCKVDTTLASALASWRTNELFYNERTTHVVAQTVPKQTKQNISKKIIFVAPHYKFPFLLPPCRGFTRNKTKQNKRASTTRGVQRVHARAKQAIDVWSVGCIFAELMLRRPFFPGDNYLDQLMIICDKLGKPKEDELDFVSTEKVKIRGEHPLFGFCMSHDLR